jgi:hypothetical protein
MNLEAVNQILVNNPPARLILQSYDAHNREVSVAFTFDGGQHETSAYLVSFHGTAIIHLPSILHEPVTLKAASMSESEQLIPKVSFDAQEYKPGGYTVYLICDPRQQPFGYYVVAEEISARWLSTKECVKAY